MSDDVTNPRYGKFEEVAEALVKPMPSPEEGVPEPAQDQIVREGDDRAYSAKKRPKQGHSESG